MCLNSRLRLVTLVMFAWSAASLAAIVEQPLYGFTDGVIPETVEKTVAQIESELELRNCTVERVIDHGLNAQAAKLSLNDTQLVLFRDPVVEERMIHRDQLTALDFPQKLLVRKLEGGQVRVISKPASTLFNRYGIAVRDRTMRLINRHTEPFTADTGIVTQQSAFDFATTLTNLQSEIINQGLKLVGDPVDFTPQAAGPTKLVMAGAPKVGTQLMQLRPSIGLDLPIKLLVWQDEFGIVNLSYNDPHYLARLYDLEGTEADALFDQMSSTLENLRLAVCKLDSP